jgi:hypothetical protein
MSLFNKREQAFEVEFGIEQESLFKKDMKAIHLLALWAQKQEGVHGSTAEFSANQAVTEAIEGKGIEGILSTIQYELAKKGVNITALQIKHQFDIYRTAQT